MSIGTFFKSVEDGAVKIVTFVVKQMTFAEEVLGAGTGSAKANIVITAVEKALEAMGVPLGTVQTELKAVVDAVTALLNKAGIFTK
ncbi:MAG TPA: hypothetical protein VN976_21820 [Verrucomicrobiae bacterium]|nr:hypothetical protein [Verrucomicrobiae bacterium]